MDFREDPLHDALAAAVEERGLCRVAGAADVSPGTLRGFLVRGTARKDTLCKLDVWANPPEPPERGPDGYYGSGA